MFKYLKNTKSLLTGLICLAYIGLFLPIGVSNITLIALLVFCLLKTKPWEILMAIKENSFSKLFLALYFVQMIGLFYTTNLHNGFFILEKKLSLLLIPLIVLPLLQKVNTDTKLILKWIGIITVASSLVLLVIATIKRLILNDPQAFFYEDFTSIHYVYYSIYFACGALLLIDALFDTWVEKKFGVLSITMLFVYSLAILILVASKTGIGAFCVASIFLLYKKIPNKKIFALSLLFLITTAFVLLYFNATTRNRFIEMDQNLSFLLLDDFRGVEVYITDLTMRLLFWKISIVHLWQDHLIMTGVGTGDAQDYINSLYILPQYELYGYVNWDSHNQWVFTFIQMGLMGILVMAILYGKYFIEGFRINDLKLICFLIITGGFSLTESILESNKGIVFFALLFTLFCSAHKKTITE